MRSPRVGPLFSLLLSLTAGSASAQSTPVARFTVDAGARARTNVPVTAYLTGVPLHLGDGELKLFETTGGKNTPVTSQLSGGNPDQLAWILAGTTPARASRTFELRLQKGAVPAAPAAPAKHDVTVADDGDDLKITVGDRPVLQYRYTPMPVPDGVREIFSSSGFIHPLWSPQGEVLTRIQPPDHRHHYGIQNPWTHTEFEGKQVDFWNLGSGQGKVKVAGVIEKTSGDVFGGFRSLHDHVVLSGPDAPKTAINETWEVKVWNVSPKAWLIDFASTMSPATSEPITIKAYRYQGFSIRATGKWGDANTTLLSSEGFNKSNGNSTRARWIDVNGAADVPAGSSGILFITNPQNFNYPEHLRIWPTGQNGGNANVYVNFNPAQDRDWPLLPGNTYGLKYRMFVYDGKISKQEAERLWYDFAFPPRVTVQPLGTP